MTAHPHRADVHSSLVYRIVDRRDSKCKALSGRTPCLPLYTLLVSIPSAPLPFATRSLDRSYLPLPLTCYFALLRIETTFDLKIRLSHSCTTCSTF